MRALPLLAGVEHGDPTALITRARTFHPVEIVESLAWSHLHLDEPCGPGHALVPLVAHSFVLDTIVERSTIEFTEIYDLFVGNVEGDILEGHADEVVGLDLRGDSVTIEEL